MLPFCMDNREAICPGRMGSYSLDICAKPLSPAMAATVFVIAILLPLLCCAGCCLAAFRWRASRRPAVTVFMPGGMVGGAAAPGQPRPLTPVGTTGGMVAMAPYPSGTTTATASYAGGGPTYPVSGPGQPTYYYNGNNNNAQPTYYSGQQAMGAPGHVAYATTTPGAGSTSPPPPYGNPGYYGGQPGQGGAYM